MGVYPDSAQHDIRQWKVNIDRTPADAENISGPDSDEIISDIDDIINALSSEDTFIAATMDDGNGVFEDAALSADDASKAFNAARRRRW